MPVRDYKILGLMSGTSLDGLDICYAHYSYTDEGWSFELKQAATYPYPEDLFNDLRDATQFSAIELYALDRELGLFFAERVNEFLATHHIPKTEVDAIASHGHTLFHQPEIGITVQIACGETISYHTGIPTINDFRKKDVVAGGQGAPLVPVGDRLLFGQEAQSFLNIGGFANISFTDANDQVIAFDICPANILINHYMRMLGHSFDKNGRIAGSYPIEHELLNALNHIGLYEERRPHSLSLEWLEKHVLPITDDYDCSIETKIATVTEHAAIQISRRLQENAITSVYITGGGSKNLHLVERIRTHFSGTVIVPDESIVDFKEALIFGFLGALHLAGEPNCLASVTGAQRDVVGGVFHRP